IRHEVNRRLDDCIRDLIRNSNVPEEVKIYAGRKIIQEMIDYEVGFFRGRLLKMAALKSLRELAKERYTPDEVKKAAAEISGFKNRFRIAFRSSRPQVLDNEMRRKYDGFRSTANEVKGRLATKGFRLTA
ncbi:hypothetical protein HYT84_00755, partial [Candidatus Micrarchaeota archaeon]|nr:hypothetical protein [Candidatus Micrarchaeota archaeon]